MTSSIVPFPIVPRSQPKAAAIGVAPRRPATGFDPEAIADMVNRLRAGDEDHPDVRARLAVEGHRR